MWSVCMAVAAVTAAGAGAGARVEAAVVEAGRCGVAEYACRGGGCVPLDAYCDGAEQCADGSDEPAQCSPCNRTYYGHAGREYRVALRPPARVPFLCHLTFTAGGGALGDLVQLGFDEFRVGRYAAAGCPDGYVQLAELGRPFTGGSWCGEATGAALYYSETSTVTLSLRVWGAAAARALALSLRFRFLSARAAVARYGAAAAPVTRGAVAPGTYCTRTYEECHRRACRLQSPNYPGMYPRNVTCYWSLRQKDVPTCKHAMISVRQDHAHKMQIKRSISMASLNKTGRAVVAWRRCTPERDRLIVYDGGSTDDPVLLVYCGGDWLPPVTSRGPDMLVAFHSSPYSAPPRAAPRLTPLRGFELDVAVVFADSDSLEYSREPRRCEFHVKASSGADESAVPAAGAEAGAGAGAGEGAAAAGTERAPVPAERGRRGVLHAPRHTLPPNTTCTWTFHGRPGDAVWIYFASYTQYSLVEPRREAPPERDDEARRGGREDGASDGGEPVEGGAGAEGGEAAGSGTSDASPWTRLRNMLRARPAPPPPRPATPAPAPAVCATSLRVWDGGGEGEAGAVLVGRYCDAAPALCARAALRGADGWPRACAPPDGYVSRGERLSLAVTSRAGTATHPLRFALHYEFVDARLPGDRLVTSRRTEPPECARLITEPGAISSPRNVLWFGRGGARRLRCLYRLEAGGVGGGGTGREGLELTLTSLSFGARPRCSTRRDARTGRLTCAPHPPPAPAVAAAPPPAPPPPLRDLDEDALEEEPDDELPLQVPHLMIYESPWPGYRVPVACLCDNGSEAWAGAGAGSVTVAGAGALELELVARALSPREDHRHLRWAGHWRRLPAARPECAPRRPAPPGGHLRVPPARPRSPAPAAPCSAPLLLVARGNRSLFLRVWGEELPLSPAAPAAAPAPSPAGPSVATDPPLCASAGRVLVYDANTGRLLKAVCPGSTEESARTVQLFTPEWWRGARGASRPPRPAALLVAWAGGAAEGGPARVAWMETWRGGAALHAALRRRLPDADNATLAGPGGAGGAGDGDGEGYAACTHACAELEACADPALWCSGAADCPRGGDEAGCGAARLLAALGGGWGAAGAAGAAAGALAALLLVVAGARARAAGAGAGAHKRPPGAAGAPPRRLTQEPLLASRPETPGSPGSRGSLDSAS